MLPTVVDNSHNFGHTHKSLFGHEIPITSSVNIVLFHTKSKHRQFDGLIFSWNFSPFSWVINRLQCGAHAVSIRAILK